jgi:abortive infection bacteriophage resistance protein
LGLEYEKPYMTLGELADRLVSRGLSADREDLIEHLRDVGYFRLSGYWNILRLPDGTFGEGASFSEVWRRYTFDRQLRLCTLDAVERVEVWLRAHLAHLIARDYGPFGYLGPEGLPRLGEERHAAFIRRCRAEYARSREPFAVHFREAYGETHDMPPIWMLVNMMDFGSILTLYRGASVMIRNEVASEVGVAARVLESWLVAINTLRNCCAHHARLWNREFGTKPRIPRDACWHEPVQVKNDRIFGLLTVMSFLLRTAAPETGWRRRLIMLLEPLPEEDLRRMGFPKGWEACPMWSPWMASQDRVGDGLRGDGGESRGRDAGR